MILFIFIWTFTLTSLILIVLESMLTFPTYCICFMLTIVKFKNSVVYNNTMQLYKAIG